MKQKRIVTILLILTGLTLLYGSVFAFLWHEDRAEERKASEPPVLSEAPDEEPAEETGELDASDYYSEKVRIGQATSNEYGQIYGGEPGDQTTRETCISKWSSDYGWVYLFRHKDPATRLKIAQYAIDICENQKIGYNASAPNRYTAWDIAEENGHDFKGITERCDTTCSQLVSMVLRAVDTPEEYAPRHMDIAAMFEVMPLNPDLTMYEDGEYTQSSEKLLPGDILLSSHHTAIVVKSPAVKE